mmetsp:Transcript_25048/g.79389  ORF Transcript_25048/g.79389 Transcript_25048/m.79389 type:complete len:267 (-) Transcript_25048:971-1771(-)
MRGRVRGGGGVHSLPGGGGHDVWVLPRGVVGGRAPRQLPPPLPMRGPIRGHLRRSGGGGTRVLWPPGWSIRVRPARGRVRPGGSHRRLLGPPALQRGPRRARPHSRLRGPLALRCRHSRGQQHLHMPTHRPRGRARILSPLGCGVLGPFGGASRSRLRPEQSQHLGGVRATWHAPRRPRVHFPRDGMPRGRMAAGLPRGHSAGCGGHDAPHGSDSRARRGGWRRSSLGHLRRPRGPGCGHRRGGIGVVLSGDGWALHGARGGAPGV